MQNSESARYLEQLISRFKMASSESTNGLASPSSSSDAVDYLSPPDKANSSSAISPARDLNAAPGNPDTETSVPLRDKKDSNFI